MTLGKGRKRITVGVLVSGILDEFTEYICKGVLHAAKMQDVNVVIFPGKYLDRDLSENRDLISTEDIQEAALSLLDPWFSCFVNPCL